MAAHERALDGACHADVGEMSSPIRFHRINIDTGTDVWESAHNLQLSECHAITSREILSVGTTDGSRPVGPGYVRRPSIGVRYSSPLADPNRSVRPSRESCGSSLWSRRCLCLHLCSRTRQRSSERFAKRGRPAHGFDEGRRHVMASRARRSGMRHTKRVAARYASTRARCVAAVAARDARSWCGATGAPYGVDRRMSAGPSATRAVRRLDCSEGR